LNIFGRHSQEFFQSQNSGFCVAHFSYVALYHRLEPRELFPFKVHLINSHWDSLLKGLLKKKCQFHVHSKMKHVNFPIFQYLYFCALYIFIFKFQLFVLNLLERQWQSFALFSVLQNQLSHSYNIYTAPYLNKNILSYQSLLWQP